MSVVLPTQIHKPQKEDFPPKGEIIIIYGEPKTGKTNFVSTFPNTLIIELDQKGASWIRNPVYVYSPKNLAELSEIPKAIAKNNLYENVAIDTVDSLAMMINDDICRREMVKSIYDIDWGRGWGELNMRITIMIDDFARACVQTGKNLFLVMHTRKGTKKSLVMTESLETWIKGRASIIGYCYKNSDTGRVKYYVDFGKGKEGNDIGSRQPFFNSITSVENTYFALAEKWKQYQSLKQKFIATIKEKVLPNLNTSPEKAKQTINLWFLKKGIANYGIAEMNWFLQIIADNKRFQEIIAEMKQIENELK